MSELYWSITLYWSSFSVSVRLWGFPKNWKPRWAWGWRTLAFILVIAVVVQFTEMVVRKTSPVLYRLLGIFLPLITTNCAVLGVALLNINLGHNFLQSALYGFSAAVGFSLVMVLFAAIRERLAVADVPAPFRGNAIALITAGLMSLAFMGFSGLVKL